MPLLDYSSTGHGSRNSVPMKSTNLRRTNWRFTPAYIFLITGG